MARKNRRKVEKTALFLGTAFTVSLSGLQSAALADDSSSGSSSLSSSSGSSSDSGSGSTSIITPLFPSTPPPSSSDSPASSTPSASGGGASSASSTPTESKWKEGDKDLTPVNPLKGLFQPQPQYPTPGTTQMFPEAVSNNMGKDSDVPGRNPGHAGSTFQTDWKDPYASPEDKNTTSVNPLKGLFQQQPQYPSPGKTQMYPEAVPQHLGNDSDVAGRHPGQAGTVFQNEWKDPYKTEDKPSKDSNNYLKGLFQQQPQYPSAGKTVVYPEAQQRNLGDDSAQPGRQPGSAGTAFQPEPTNTYESEIKANASAFSTVSTEKKEEKAEDKKAEGEKKEGDKKDDEKKDDASKKAEADKKDADKKADTDKKDGDKKAEAGKDGDKKDSKATDKKDGDKKDDKKDGDKKADSSSDKKDGDKDKDKKEEVKYLPYNPLRESISLMNTGQFNESIQLLTKEIQKSAKNAEAFYMRAVVYVRMRKYDLAANDYKEVLKLVPTGPFADMAKKGLMKIHL